MPQGMPYPKGEMSMKNPGKSMRSMMGMKDSPAAKTIMPMKGKKAGSKKMTMDMKNGKS